MRIKIKFAIRIISDLRRDEGPEKNHARAPRSVNYSPFVSFNFLFSSFRQYFWSQKLTNHFRRIWFALISNHSDVIRRDIVRPPQRSSSSCAAATSHGRLQLESPHKPTLAPEHPTTTTICTNINTSSRSCSGSIVLYIQIESKPTSHKSFSFARVCVAINWTTYPTEPGLTSLCTTHIRFRPINRQTGNINLFVQNVRINLFLNWRSTSSLFFVLRSSMA